MTAQPEALRLADRLEGRWALHPEMQEAAAELRRQHEEITELRHGAGVAHQTIAGLVAQRDALKQTLHDELAGNLRLRDLGGARPDEPMLTFLERIIAERDALLAALRDLVQLEADGRTEYESAIPHWDAARAAIKAVEEGK